ncbi:MAG: hypothetical protein WBP41_12260 [Saprospiraceae bacterium]
MTTKILPLISNVKDISVVDIPKLTEYFQGNDVPNWVLKWQHNKLIETYQLIFDSIVYNNYTREANLSWEEEVQLFYDHIEKDIIIQPEKIEYGIKCLFKSICLYFLGDYKGSFSNLTQFNMMAEKYDIKYVNKTVGSLLNEIYTQVRKKSILIVVSNNGKPLDKNDQLKRDQLLKHDFKLVNYECQVNDASDYTSIEEILSESLNYDFVFFVGHGGDYFTFALEGGFTELTCEHIIDKFLTASKRPKIFAVLSCAYELYIPLAQTGLFKYFILSSNSNIENDEIFTKSFIYAIDRNKKILHSLHLSLIALMCRNSGPNQLDIFKAKNILDFKLVDKE